MASEFYGSIEGQAGDATRRGSKRSGYHAWAQDSTTQVAVYLSHNDATDTNFAEIEIRGSSLNYGAGSGVYIGKVDMCIANHLRDPQVKRALDRARGEILKATNRARKLDGRGPLA